jgi:pyruvate/2-oxoacid:ferredoxin oxidoreductase beta subunit
MLGEFNVVDKSIEEILIYLMVDNFMSTGVQASSTRAVQASSSTARGSRPS